MPNNIAVHSPILFFFWTQVALYDDCEKLIVSRFLKKDEVIECGGMLAFETHLVDIGDPEVSHTPSVDLNVPREDVKLKERAGAEGEKVRIRNMTFLPFLLTIYKI